MVRIAVKISSDTRSETDAAPGFQRIQPCCRAGADQAFILCFWREDSGSREEFRWSARLQRTLACCWLRRREGSQRAADLEVSTSGSLVKLQVLLRREWRTSQGIDEVRRILTSVGLTPTAAGLATISAEVGAERFEDLFGVPASELAPRPPGERDFGESGGHVSPELTVPTPLLQYVESISAAPPHTYLQS
jgi:hypothetical protein